MQGNHELINSPSSGLIYTTERYEAVAGKQLTKEEQEEITNSSIWEVKEQLALELYEKEKALPGSISLSAGSCTICKSARGNDKDSSKVSEGWCTRLEGKLPSYFVLVSGLLRP